jgi:hypothetical protein
MSGRIHRAFETWGRALGVIQRRGSWFQPGMRVQAGRPTFDGIRTSPVSSRFCSLCRGQSKDGRPEQKIHVEGRKSTAEPDDGKG